MSDRIRSLSALRWLTAAGLLLAGDGAALAAQQPGAQPIGAPSPPATPPAPLGPSGRITNWLSIRSEFRGRLEGFSGGAYKPDNSDRYMLDRFRINVTATASPVARFVVQVHDARAFDKTTGGAAVPFRDTLDLRMAYGEFGGARNMVRAGRQELAFGEQRLIGHSELGQHRALLRRGARDDRAQAVQVRRVRGVGGHDSAGGLRQERLRQPALRVLRVHHEDHSEGDRRAVSVLAAVGRAHARNRRTRRHQAGDDRHACRREAAARFRLRHRNGGADRFGRDRRCAGVGGSLGDRQDVHERAGQAAAVHRIQLRLGRQRFEGRRAAARSTSSIRPATTSWASPIRSAGRTSITCAAASS